MLVIYIFGEKEITYLFNKTLACTHTGPYIQLAHSQFSKICQVCEVFYPVYVVVLQVQVSEVGAVAQAVDLRDMVAVGI